MHIYLIIFASKRNGTVLRNSFGCILCCEKLYTKGYHCKFMWRKWRKSSLALSSMSLVIRIPPNSLTAEAWSSFGLGSCISADSAVMTHLKEVKFMSVSWTHWIKKPTNSKSRTHFTQDTRGGEEFQMQNDGLFWGRKFCQFPIKHRQL